MHLKRFILLLLSISYAYYSFAQAKSDLTQSRVLILLDESSSMIQSWPNGGMEKYRAADTLILRLMDSVYAVNSDVEFSLRVFGHQHTVEENNCYDTKNEVAFSKDNLTQMAFRLADIRPLGVTPIAYALQQAAEHDLVDELHNAYSIILITDGGESCGGNICDVMQRLFKDKVYFKPYIVSLEDNPALKTTYSCMGDYLQVTKSSDIPVAVNTIVEAFRPAIKITREEYKHLQTIAASVPSVLKVNTPIVTEQPKDTIAIRETPASRPVETINPVTIKKDTLPQTVIKPVPVPVPKPAPPKKDTIKKSVVKTARLPVPAPAPIVVKQQPVPVPPAPVVPDTLVVTPKPEPVKIAHHIVVGDVPDRPAPVKTVRITPAAQSTIKVCPPPSKKVKTIQVEQPPLVMLTDTPATPPPVKIAHLKPAKFHTFNVLFIIEDHVLEPRSVPPPPPLKIPDIATRPVSRIPIPARQPVPPGKRGGYTVEAEPAKETSLAVYFTNGVGKYYTSTPQMVLVDPRSKKVIKKFFRTVDPNGDPDPQTDIPEGTYDIAIVGSRSLVIHDVDIVKNNKNKLIIKVKSSSLKFAYLNAPNRPVKEFMAIVTERNSPHGKVVTQKCTEELVYEPANYHIVINTFPEDTRNVDLDLDDETVITILQPGFAKFTPQGNSKVVTLFLKSGDKFLSFYTLDLTDAKSQHLQIQPGEYQAHYHKGPGGSSVSEKVVPFTIKATEETEVILK